MLRATAGEAVVRGLLRALALLVLAVFVRSALAASILVVQVDSEGLNVRSQPSAASDVVGYLKRGETTVATLGSNDGWLLVRTRDGRAGYIAARYVKLVRVLAVDGDPVPSRPAGRDDGGPCGPSAGPIEVAIRDARIACRDRVLGSGVDACEVHFAVEAVAACTERIYRALECEVVLAYLLGQGDEERTAEASATTVMVLDAGVGASELSVSWQVPGGPPVSAVRLASGSCLLR